MLDETGDLEGTALGGLREARNEDETSRTLLGTVHRLLSLEKIASFQEVLLTSVIEILAVGGKSVDSLLVGLEELWPASELRREHVLAVLDRASELSLARRVETLLPDEQSWELTDAGRAEVTSTQTWYADALGSFARDIQRRAAEDFGFVTAAQAGIWAALVVAAMSQSMHSNPESVRGAVRRRVDGGLAPERFSIAQSLEYLEARASDEHARGFLKAALLAAMDESEPFGNELATAVATAAVLRGVVARQGDAQELESLGGLDGIRIVIDTPCLLDLLAQRDEDLQLISSAVGCGMQVIVFQHYLDELSQLLDRVAADHPHLVLRAPADREAARVAALLADDQVVEMFLQGVALGRYSDWTVFTAAAAALQGTLTQAGATVRPAGNAGEDTVLACRDALVEVLEERGSNRGRIQTDRDAETLAAVWRWRRRALPGSAQLWPVGWVLTRDTKMNSAFTRATGDEQDVAITPSRLSTLLATLGPPAESARLVSVAASEMRHEAMIAVAMRYPPEIAFDLAQGLVRSDTATTDTRIAQLGLGDLLDQASGHPTVTGDRLASEVLARRTQRINAAASEAQRRSQATEAAAEERAGTAESALAHKERALQHTLGELGDRPTKAELAAAVTRERKIGNRRAVRAVVVTFLCAIAVVLIFLKQFYAALGFAAAALWFYEQAGQWVEDPDRRWGRLLVVCAAVALGVVLQFLL